MASDVRKLVVDAYTRGVRDAIDGKCAVDREYKGLTRWAHEIEFGRRCGSLIARFALEMRDPTTREGSE